VVNDAVHVNDKGFLCPDGPEIFHGFILYGGARDINIAAARPGGPLTSCLERFSFCIFKKEKNRAKFRPAGYETGPVKQEKTWILKN
jgi:hypothetical protein